MAHARTEIQLGYPTNEDGGGGVVRRWGSRTLKVAFPSYIGCPPPLITPCIHTPHTIEIPFAPHQTACVQIFPIFTPCRCLLSIDDGCHISSPLRGLLPYLLKSHGVAILVMVKTVNRATLFSKLSDTQICFNFPSGTNI